MVRLDWRVKMNEIEVLVKQENGVLNFNYEQIKEQLEAEMKLYSSLVFTEDQKATAKKDIANLRKLKTAIDSKRKEVKKSFMKPYDDFEGKVKELITLIDEPITLIDKQVAEFEAKQKAEKQEKIKEIFAEVIEDNDFITLQSIYKKEWENVSTSLKSIKTDITDKIFSIKQDLATIDAFGSDAGEKARQTYLSNGYNLGPCVQYIQQYEQQKKEIEERERIRKEQEAKRLEEQRIAEEKRAQEEEQRRLEEQRVAEMKAQEQEQNTGFVVEETKGFVQEEQKGFAVEEPQGFAVPETTTVNFAVTGTAEQIMKVRNYLTNINVDYKEN